MNLFIEKPVIIIKGFVVASPTTLQKLEAYNKVLKVIQSVKTMPQFECALKTIHNFTSLYGYEPDMYQKLIKELMDTKLTRIIP